MVGQLYMEWARGGDQELSFVLYKNFVFALINKTLGLSENIFNLVLLYLKKNRKL
jgi:hypothetical protein